MSLTSLPNEILEGILENLHSTDRLKSRELSLRFARIIFSNPRLNCIEFDKLDLETNEIYRTPDRSLNLQECLQSPPFNSNISCRDLRLGRCFLKKINPGFMSFAFFETKEPIKALQNFLQCRKIFADTVEIPWGEVDFELEPLLSAIDVRRLRVFTEKLPETREISLKIPSSCRFFQLHDFAFQRFLIIDLSEAENLLKIHLFNWKISDLGKESEKAEKIVQLVQKFYGPLKRNRVREISEAEIKAFEGKLNEFDVDLRQKGEWKEITFNSINLLIKFKVDLNCSYSS